MCLAAALVISVITISNLLDRNNALQKEVDSAKKEQIKEQEIFDIIPGDTGIIKNYGLSYRYQYLHHIFRRNSRR